MRRSDELYPVQQPRTRTRTPWELMARKILDAWGGGAETNIAAALEQSYGDGIEFAAKFISESGQPELARALKAAAEGDGAVPRAGQDAVRKEGT